MSGRESWGTAAIIMPGLVRCLRAWVEGGVDGGLWVCAGYTGHGMPAAALSAREVVRQMKGGGVTGADGEGERVRLPGEFALSEDRVGRARELPHLTQGWEATNFATLIGGPDMPAGGKGM